MDDGWRWVPSRHIVYNVICAPGIPWSEFLITYHYSLFFSRIGPFHLQRHTMFSCLTKIAIPYCRMFRLYCFPIRTLQDMITVEETTWRGLRNILLQSLEGACHLVEEMRTTYIAVVLFKRGNDSLFAFGLLLLNHVVCKLFFETGKSIGQVILGRVLFAMSYLVTETNSHF